MLVAIDTATHSASVALYDGSSVLGEVTWKRRETHTRNLMTELVRLLELSGLTIQDAQAIAVTTGPGSFTGLRSGLAAAKGIAFSTNAKLIGISTLDVTAAPAMLAPGNDSAHRQVCAVIEAGRGRYGAAVYANRNGFPARGSEYLFGPAESIVNQVQESVSDTGGLILAGEVDDALCDAFRSRFGGRVMWENVAMHLRRAGVLAVLGWERFQQGEADEIESLAPYYIPTAALGAGT